MPEQFYDFTEWPNERLQEKAEDLAASLALHPQGHPRRLQLERMGIHLNFELKKRRENEEDAVEIDQDFLSAA